MSGLCLVPVQLRLASCYPVRTVDVVPTACSDRSLAKSVVFGTVDSVVMLDCLP